MNKNNNQAVLQMLKDMDSNPLDLDDILTFRDKNYPDISDPQIGFAIMSLEESGDIDCTPYGDIKLIPRN